MSIATVNHETNQLCIGGRCRDIPPPVPTELPPQRSTTVRWLGLNWIGVPWPKRIRIRWPVYVLKYQGCGCIKPLKELVSKHG